MLIAQMVARNEANRYLVDVLTHLKSIVDVIIFTDDASDDDTPNIAYDMGAQVFQMDKPTFVSDESHLRQEAWNHLAEFAARGDWVLAIDADEKLYGVQHLGGLLDQSQFDVLGVSFYHMWNQTHYRVDKAWAPNVSSRLFRFVEGGEFRGRKLACGSEPQYVQELIRQRRFYTSSPLKMQHLGYVDDADKVAKYKRYMELDGGDYHSRAHIESILDPNPALLPWME